MRSQKKKKSSSQTQESDFEKIVLGILIAILIVSAGFSFYIFFMDGQGGKEETKNTAQATTTSQSGLSEIITGSAETGDVAIQLKPLGIKDGKLIFEFAANTHSVSLSDFDLSEITTLEYDNIDILPESVPTMSGHHASGQLIFGLGVMPDNFTVKIKGIPSVSERIYQWSTK